MKITARNCSKVPVFCVAASWLCYVLTVWLGRFIFVAQTVDADGEIVFYADPVRSTLFQMVLFLILLFVGGLRTFRTMTKGEIALSAAIISTIYLLVTVLELTIPNFPAVLRVQMGMFGCWADGVFALAYRLTGSMAASAILADLMPFLFVPFGRKKTA